MQPLLNPSYASQTIPADYLKKREAPKKHTKTIKSSNRIWRAKN